MPPSDVVPQKLPAPSAVKPLVGPRPRLVPTPNCAMVVWIPVAIWILKTVPSPFAPPELVVPHRFPAPSGARVPTGDSPRLGPVSPLKFTTVVKTPVATWNLNTVPRSFAPP